MADEILLRQPTPPRSFDDRIRLVIVWFVFAQFNIFVVIALVITMIAQHKFTEAGENLMMIIATGELALMGTAAGYFLGGAAARKANGNGNGERPK